MLWKTVWRFLKKLGINLVYDPAIPLLGISPEKATILCLTITLNSLERLNGHTLLPPGKFAGYCRYFSPKVFFPYLPTLAPFPSLSSS